MRRVACWLLGLLLGCSAGHLQSGVFRKNGKAYQAHLPPKWTPVSFRGNDVAFVDETSRFLLALNSTCEGFDDAPLKVLMADLLLGFDQKEGWSQSELSLDGRAALRGHFHATLDGVPVDMALVVLKKDGCVYDFTYLAPRGRFEERVGLYNALLRRFTTEVP